MKPAEHPKNATVSARISRGLAGWVLSRLSRGRGGQPRLAMVERIPLAPRHSLALIEADGQRLLVATSSEKGSVFYKLDAAESCSRGTRPTRRTSW